MTVEMATHARQMMMYLRRILVRLYVFVPSLSIAFWPLDNTALVYDCYKKMLGLHCRQRDVPNIYPRTQKQHEQVCYKHGPIYNLKMPPV